MKAFLVTFILASVSALVLGIGNDTDEEIRLNIFITNGYAAPEGKAPYLVSLEFRKEGSNGMTICGGSIIGHTWVVTAAHCLTGDYVDINYGSNWRGRGAYKHSVRNDQWIRNSLWPNTNGNDIALLRTPHVDFSSTVNKVNLPKLSQRNERFENWWAVTCGWGGQANGQLADWLQCADLQIMSNDECSRSYGSIPEGILCVKTPDGKSTCGGDSGGSLVTHDNPILVGITSFGSAAGCTAGHPAGFTRVTVHLDWIKQHTGIVYN